jgi:hypothetical protein
MQARRAYPSKLGLAAALGQDDTWRSRIAVGAGPMEVATKAGHTSVSFRLDATATGTPSPTRPSATVDGLHDGAADGEIRPDVD